MSISNWLESPGQFRKLLAALVSDNWEHLVDSLCMDEPVLRQFASTQWARRRLPDDPSPLAFVTLLIAYHYRCLLLDSIRPDNPTGNGLQGELNVTLLIPLYIWPAYHIWILQEFPPKSRIKQVEAIHWLLDANQRETGFLELEIEEPDRRLLTYLELKKNTTNLSRWIKDGFDRACTMLSTWRWNSRPLLNKDNLLMMNGHLTQTQMMSLTFTCTLGMSGYPDLMKYLLWAEVTSPAKMQSISLVLQFFSLI